MHILLEMPVLSLQHHSLQPAILNLPPYAPQSPAVSLVTFRDGLWHLLVCLCLPSLVSNLRQPLQCVNLHHLLQQFRRTLVAMIATGTLATTRRREPSLSTSVSPTLRRRATRRTRRSLTMRGTRTVWVSPPLPLRSPTMRPTC